MLIYTTFLLGLWETKKKTREEKKEKKKKKEKKLEKEEKGVKS